MSTVEEWTDKELSAAIALAYRPSLLGQVNCEREAYIALQSARARIAELEAELFTERHMRGTVQERLNKCGFTVAELEAELAERDWR